ncbi:electron transfer DM13 [Prauserella shujinwangii]|uniref:Electron transfer DM13 n=1 Tax=Prauserella shujinwangii TaxID=1453103 RepID=A0A2T0LVN0_9PSEU|nr:DM13 domain-containing protein [Prauserella shujinwangii]PRX47868.1 electron transfer DM13 [Prauserella shujinwangii]
MNGSLRTARRSWRRGRVLWPVAAFAIVLAVAALWAFEPWRAFTRSTVDEPVPAAPVAGETGAGSRADPVELAAGRFVSEEHETTGTARVLELPDGSRILRLAGFSTSDGPDVHVWLSSAEAGADQGGYDDGRYVALGELKATDGNQNYAIPRGVRLTGLRSAVIWCDRFNVSFGSAPLAW